MTICVGTICEQEVGKENQSLKEPKPCPLSVEIDNLTDVKETDLPGYVFCVCCNRCRQECAEDI